LLRTNLGRAQQLRQEILQAHTRGLPLAGASWRDVPMIAGQGGWWLELPLVEPGFFKAKPYLVDPQGWQHWPQGPDVGISVHPDAYRSANTIYCAFTRLFGPSRTLETATDDARETTFAPLDKSGYTVIPPSGKLRDLIQFLPHIFETLGCRILQLLPINPTPTTYARFGRFGSPYAALDLIAIDPALIVFDKRTTGVDQFRELTYTAHLHGGQVFLDLIINHTGWESCLLENHPEWFLRQPDGCFASPGAWGTTWEDLVELVHRNVGLWDELAEVFVTWCRRGVDGFRCDAGYKVPVPAWQYIVARVQQEYPETIFLLEGLGGAWEATEALLTDGGMQWAYSELFQNYSGQQVAAYLDHSTCQSERSGILVHYSETHDNQRLASRGRAWSLMRNRLCALTSVAGGYAFTCGVEWLATEQIRVHGSTGLTWGNADNLLPELLALNRLLAEHPCFFDGAKLTRLSPPDSPVYALWRESEEGKDSVLVLVNTDLESAHKLVVKTAEHSELQRLSASLPFLSSWVDLLGQATPMAQQSHAQWTITLPAGAAFCLAPAHVPQGLAGELYRQARARAAWGLTALSHAIPTESINGVAWRELAAQVERSPERFLAKVAQLDPSTKYLDLAATLREPDSHDARSAPVPGRRTGPRYARVVTWSLADIRRITPVPAKHWLLIQDTARFRASVALPDGSPVQNVASIPVREGHVACFPPHDTAIDTTLSLERYSAGERQVAAAIRYLPPGPSGLQPKSAISGLVLLTNRLGGMARIPIDLGRVLSKYDCVLGANLHPSLPVDRHIFAKRIRVWVNADGFISPLDFRSLDSFMPGPPAIWNFVANAGDGRTVEIHMTAEMVLDRNTTVFRFGRPTAEQATGKQLPATADVRLTVRVDIEDRNFHWETHRNGGAEYHFWIHTHPIAASKQRAREIAAEQRHAVDKALVGFAFTPARDRQLRVFTDAGSYHPQPEWSENIAHPVEQSRCQVPAGDAISPGWFELPLPKGASVTLFVTAEQSEDVREAAARESLVLPEGASLSDADIFSERLRRAIRAFVVRRDCGKTIIAGYPWFLDWGRDTFICARGLLAAGMLEDVRQIVLTFARFEKDGTLPNTIFGADASNRDTSDAPLWFGLVCEELAGAEQSLDSLTAAYLQQQLPHEPSRSFSFSSSCSKSGQHAPPGLYATVLEGSRRTLLDVLTSIAKNYIRGTPNGIRTDPASGLIWSPSHFTWMDTNYPAATPREGYPIEIQALWIRLLRQLAAVGSVGERAEWVTLADKAQASLERLYWLEDRGYYSDVLLAKPGQPAADARPDDALRGNCLFVISLGLAEPSRARRCVEAAKRWLVVPGALRSLAPLPVSVPLPVYAPDGRLLNDPKNPYWGRYEGDEDTRRKPAYHNGTAWTWTFPVFCEALARAWDFSPEAVAAAKSYLVSIERLLNEGCLGQLPEILDGDAPHQQRGCDAQAWAATEALRVWHLLSRATRAE